MWKTWAEGGHLQLESNHIKSNLAILTHTHILIKVGIKVAEPGAKFGSLQCVLTKDLKACNTHEWAERHDALWVW